VGGAVLVLSKRGADTRIPFGPYLALGGILGLVWGRPVITWWLGSFPA
jgi:leader peptidase (prepilin peptidase)/N-methyltransferase